MNVDSFSSDELVERYEDRTQIGLFEQERTAISEYFDPTGGRVLDVGCGVGRTTKPLADRGFDVVGIDISSHMIDRASKMFPGIDFRIGDVTDMEFEDDTFEYALFGHNGIDYVHPASEREAAFLELRRVLDEDGVLVFSTHNAWYRFPAALSDWSFLKTFYLEHGNPKRLFRRYKIDVIDGDTLWTHLTTPIQQRRQLRRCGFKSVEQIGKRGKFGRLFEAMPHFVAKVD